MTLHALNTAIYSKIAGTATSAGSAVFFMQAPDNQSMPYIVFDYTADLDENMTANRTKNSVLFIRAYASSPSAAGSIDAQVDALLHLKPLTVTGWSAFWMARESGYSLPEVDAAGRKSYMVGSEFRIRLDSA